jgi:4-nitrophenyl phosphatase
MGIQAFCVTNNSTRSITYYLERMAGFGVSLDPTQIITSAEATADFVLSAFPQQGDLFVIGEEGVIDALERRGFQLIQDESGDKVVAVVVGLDRKFTYRNLDLAVRYIRQGALFVGTNPDLTIPTPTGQSPGAGTIIASVEKASGVEPQIIGKPFSALYELALSRGNSLPEETLMIGDRLETDISGAQQLGIRTAVVLSGIATLAQVESWDPAPDIIAEDANQVIKILMESDG